MNERPSIDLAPLMPRLKSIDDASLECFVVMFVCPWRTRRPFALEWFNRRARTPNEIRGLMDRCARPDRNARTAILTLALARLGAGRESGRSRPPARGSAPSPSQPAGLIRKPVASADGRNGGENGGLGWKESGNIGAQPQ
jgi:hypothetical protein